MDPPRTYPRAKDLVIGTALLVDPDTGQVIRTVEISTTLEQAINAGLMRGGK